jgi:hypothetical protein
VCPGGVSSGTLNSNARSSHKSEASVVRLSQNGVRRLKNELGEKNLIATFVYLETYEYRLDIVMVEPIVLGSDL